MSQTTEVLDRLLACGLSQLEIQRRTGIPQPRLSRWANGATPVGADDALRLKALLDEVEVSRSHPELASTQKEASNG